MAAYINDYAFRNKTQVINLGDSMRNFMDQVLHDTNERRADGRKSNRIGGQNGKEIKRELENFAAAQITLGLWSPDGTQARSPRALVSKDLNFWLEKNPDQKSLWHIVFFDPVVAAGACLPRGAAEHHHFDRALFAGYEIDGLPDEIVLWIDDVVIDEAMAVSVVREDQAAPEFSAVGGDGSVHGSLLPGVTVD